MKSFVSPLHALLHVRLVRAGAVGLLALSVALLPACAGNRSPDAAPASTLPMTPGSTLGDAIAQASANLEKARSSGLAAYSPGYLEKAAESLASAQKLLGKGKTGEARWEASMVETHLRSAEANRALAQTTLKDAVAERENLIAIGAPDRLPRDFAKIEEDFRDAMLLLEANKVEKAAREQPHLLAAMARVEIDTLRTLYLDPARAQLLHARQIDAQEYARISYRLAEQAAADTDRMIQATPKSRDEIKAAGDNALALATRAVNVSIESRQLARLDPAAAENQVLRIFGLLSRINEPLKVPGLDTMGLSEQASSLEMRASELARRTRISGATDGGSPAVAPPVPPAP